MSAFDAAQAEATNYQRCGVVLVGDALTPEQRLDLSDALGNQRISGAVISQVLRDWGHVVGAAGVRRHRRGECACPK